MLTFRHKKTGHLTLKTTIDIVVCDVFCFPVDPDAFLADWNAYLIFGQDGEFARAIDESYSGLTAQVVQWILSQYDLTYSRS